MRRHTPRRGRANGRCDASSDQCGCATACRCHPPDPRPRSRARWPLAPVECCFGAGATGRGRGRPGSGRGRKLGGSHLSGRDRAEGDEQGDDQQLLHGRMFRPAGGRPPRGTPPRSTPGLGGTPGASASRGGQTRTVGLPAPNRALYQAELRPATPTQCRRAGAASQPPPLRKPRPPRHPSLRIPRPSS